MCGFSHKAHWVHIIARQGNDWLCSSRKILCDEKAVYFMWKRLICIVANVIQMFRFYSHVLVHCRTSVCIPVVTRMFLTQWTNSVKVDRLFEADNSFQVDSSASFMETPVVLILTFWRRNYFFLILAHSVYKMWIIQEPSKLELWNKLHFKEKKTESIHHVYNIRHLYLLNKYIKCNFGC